MPYSSTVRANCGTMPAASHMTTRRVGCPAVRSSRSRSACRRTAVCRDELRGDHSLEPAGGGDRPKSKEQPHAKQIAAGLRSDAYQLDVFASAFIARNKFEISRRRAMASAV
jgi:hypothetical protein